jgi:hypothetical protein
MSRDHHQNWYCNLRQIVYDQGVNKLVVWSIVIAVLVFLFSTQVKAWNTHETFHCYHSCQVPTPRPILTPSPIYTPRDCEGGETYSVWQACPTMEPSPTAGQSATPTPEQPHQDISDGESSNLDATLPHSASCTIQFDAPLLQGFNRVTPSSVYFSWWGVAGIDKYSLIYGYSPQSLIYGVDNIGPDATSITIDSLEANRTIWAQLLAYKGGCASYSTIIDP